MITKPAVSLFVALALAGGGVAPSWAQLPDPGLSTRPDAQHLVITSGTGQLVQLPAPASAVVAADPRVARVQPLSPTSLFVVGVTAGRTTVLATGEGGQPVAQLDITVKGSTGPVAETTPVPTPVVAPVSGGTGTLSAAQMQAALRRTIQTARAVTIAGTDEGIVLGGTVPTPQDAEQVFAFTRAMAGEKRPVINRMAVPGSVQVNVRVRIAEISRNITRDLGFNWTGLASLNGATIGLQTAAAVSALANGGGALSIAGKRGADINAVVDALAADSLISILAEPNLTAMSGETASFLAGGEYPIPVSGSTTNGATQISISFKQYGVSLSFTPTVLGPDRLNLRIRPEVSQLSAVGAVSLPIGNSALTIPALTVRRADTTIELGSGQSFAIAGLLQRSSSQEDSGTSGLSDIPVLGALFRSDRFKRSETELVIIVTPYLVKPVDPVMAQAPTDKFQPATDLDRILLQRQVGRASAARPNTTLNAGFILE